MHFLLLCILSSTGIFIVFKSIDRLGIPSFPVIVINYLLATILGFLINPGQPSIDRIMKMEWLPSSILIGILFIVMFFLVAQSSKKAGISVTTVASKMSVIFPILFSMLIDSGDRLSLVKAVAILFTLCGVALTVYNPMEGMKGRAAVYIPLILFVGMGIVDSLVKYAQHHYVSDNHTALFSAVLFLNAFIAGILVLIFTPKYYRSLLRPAVWGWGILLGAVNFGSIFFIVRALNFTSRDGGQIDSSVIFGINNTGIVALSVMAGLLIFGERLKPVNWVGISLSAFALILFSMG
ncbi:MAG: DMT family transporter [Bacteroidetes bacterium]|nr:DMT family transporter [Bacteroidota bacterium]